MEPASKMGQIYPGCLLARLPSPHSALLQPRDGGAAPLAFFEYAPRAPLPTLATLARYRKALKSEVKISLVAPKSTFTSPKGAMRPGPEIDAGVDWLTRVSDILGAFAIVLPTGKELTPGARDRGLLSAFVERLKPTGRTIVIAPGGLWEHEEAAAFATSIGAVYGFDALENDAPPGDVIYARVRPMGARPRLTEGYLMMIAERLINAEEAFVSIDSDNALRDMKRLSAALSGLALSPDEEEEEDEDDEDEDDEDEDDEDDEDGDKEGDEDEDDEDEDEDEEEEEEE
jgi:hypothetical protein